MPQVSMDSLSAHLLILLKQKVKLPGSIQPSSLQARFNFWWKQFLSHDMSIYHRGMIFKVGTERGYSDSG